MGAEEIRIKLRQSNRIVNESLEKIDELFFNKQYQQADRTLAKIMRDNEEHKEGLCLDVLAFLGGRGRGKTSAMYSYFSYLSRLQEKNDWSEVSVIAVEKKIRFLTLPYIDAAMLADAEYIIDIILAEMWDEFEKYVKECTKAHETNFERLEREIKQKFIDVRKAYLLLKEREEGKLVSVEKEVPVPSALHELASGIDLQQKLQSLIDDYLSIFQYEREIDYYLVIAIDDVDMSGKKAHYILEQIRRFLCMKKVVVLITADIDRLQIACESRYKDIYDEANDRRKFINEYLEKVLPYNMRIYMPEIRERHDDIAVETAAREKLGLRSNDEKNMILEYMAKKCNIYFDGVRRKRHFLQNQSMRSMVNYFEQMIRTGEIKEDCLAWLKVDLKERIIERIIDIKQKSFMNELLAKDYEDVNSSIIAYVKRHNGWRFSENFYENSMGQALYLCREYEDFEEGNTDFVNAVILLYSIMMQQKDEELKKSIIGESLWGETEYGLVSAEAAYSPFCRSFGSVGTLEMSVMQMSEAAFRAANYQDMLRKIVEDNRDGIVAWLCSMLFVSIGEEDSVEFELDEERSASFDWDEEEFDWADLDSFEDFPGDYPDDFQEESQEASLESDDGGAADTEIEDEDILYDWTITFSPKFNARKSYLTNAFGNYQEQYKALKIMLSSVFMKLAGWVRNMTEDKNAGQETTVGDVINELTENLLDDIKEIIREDQAENELKNQVEILYNIGKVLAEQWKPDEANVGEAYRMLVSNYKIIKRELEKRDKYFSENIDLGQETKFAENFGNSPQAKVLLQGSSLNESQRKIFEVKMGNLLLELRNNPTVIQKAAG